MSETAAEEKKSTPESEAMANTEPANEASLEEETSTTEDEKVADITAAKPEVDYKEKYYYLAAEMENMRKRFEREKDGILKYGSEKILSGLIDVIDNFDRTVDSLANDEDEKIKNIVTGIEMVRGQFLSVLEQSGLKTIDAMGEIFDPNMHEALSQQEVEGVKEQEIVQVFQKGYVLNGRLLRAAKVVISK